jgi:RND superfamily putative drug exporter
MISGVVSPLFGKLSDVQKNDNSKFLPASSPSQVAAVQIAPFLSGTKSIFPALIVFQGNVTGPTIAALNGFASTIASEKLVDDKGNSYKDDKGNPINATVGQYFAANSQAMVIPKPGQAALVNVELDGDKATNVLSGKTRALAAIVSTLRYNANNFAHANNLTTHTAGLAALFSDLFGAFGGIDGKLLYFSLAVVSIILIVVYRSPVLWILPLMSAGFALTLAGGLIYELALHNVITLDGQSQGILSVLVIGAATDYALLLISRYREELHHEESRVLAMRRALRGVLEPIVASGSTVTISLLVLLLSQLSNNRGLGPVGAIGIIAAMVTILTFLPALLVLFGRWIFWPKRPKAGSEDEKLSGVWSKIANATAKSPKKFAFGTAAFLLILVGFLWTLQPNGLSTIQGFTNKPDSVVGQAVVDKYFSAGVGEPTQVVVPQNEVSAVSTAVMTSPAVASVAPAMNPMTGQPNVINGNVLLNITMKQSAESTASSNAIPGIRAAVSKVDPKLVVGGTSGVYYDTHRAANHDQHVIIPVVLLLIMIILSLLLRSILAGFILLLTVILSYTATLGAAAITFHHIFHFAGVDTSFPIFAFIFLVALGIDYNIFLMTRVREESLKFGTREGTRKGVTVNGGVITSAGIVLAGTFTVLGVLPLVFLAEIAFAVAFGVLLDTLVVRSLLVPAIAHILGDKIWWPSKAITTKE